MEKDRTRYNWINGIVILAALGIFICIYGNIRSVFLGRDMRHVLVLLAAAFMVHLIKAGRLYLALYGTGIGGSEYIKIYCKVTPVSMVLPLKLGEFFRMYGYGKQLDDLLKGIIIILLDRFMDTLALIAMIFLVWIFNGGKITFFIYLLLLFLVCILLAYFAFPGIYGFWKKYILKARATEKRLALLRILDSLNLVYREITDVSKGRGLILCFISFLAWAAEIGSLAMLNGISGEGELSQIISAYLLSAVGAGTSTELKQFVFLSVLLMITLYFVMKGLEVLKERGVPG